ncbi:hypothetical protein PMAYCL1PPCAC_06822, partial [Pristionchus mayeri]
DGTTKVHETTTATTTLAPIETTITTTTLATTLPTTKSCEPSCECESEGGCSPCPNSSAMGEETVRVIARTRDANALAVRATSMSTWFRWTRSPPLPPSTLSSLPLSPFYSL